MIDRVTLLRDEHGRLRTIWRFSLFGGGLLLVLIFVNIVVGGAAAICFIRSGVGRDDLARAFKEHTIELQMLAALPMCLPTFGLVWLFRVKLDRRPLRSLGLGPPTGGPPVWLGFLAGVGLATVALGVSLLLGGHRYAGPALHWHLIPLVLTLLLMAFNEELIFRGYVLQNLFDVDRPLLGIGLSSVLFWLVHSLNPGAWASPLVPVNLLGAGVLLALGYRLGGNLWFPTALHFGWNLGQGILFGIPTSGLRLPAVARFEATGTVPAWLAGGDFGLEQSVLSAALELALIAVFAVMLKRQAARRGPRS
jgi:membrane protease YdiL (CAAX protease family)